MTFDELEAMTGEERREHFEFEPEDQQIWTSHELAKHMNQIHHLEEKHKEQLRQEEQEKVLNELTQEWIKLCRQLDWNKPRRARELGVSVYLVYQFEQGRAGCESEIFSKVKALVDKYLGRVIEVLPFENTDLVYKLCGEVAESRDIRAIIGQPGMGKSHGLTHFHHVSYAEGRGRAILYVALIGLSRAGFARSLARAVGLSPEGNTDEVVGSIIEALRNDPAVLIIDEANHLPIDLLNLLRQIQDQAGCGLVLAGTGELFETLKSNRHLRQLHNRIASFEVLSGELSDDEMQMAMTKVFGEPISDASFRAMVEVTGKNIRMLIQLIKNLRRLGVDSSNLTPTMVENAGAKLISNQLGRIPRGSVLSKLRKAEPVPKIVAEKMA